MLLNRILCNGVSYLYADLQSNQTLIHYAKNLKEKYKLARSNTSSRYVFVSECQYRFPAWNCYCEINNSFHITVCKNQAYFSIKFHKLFTLVIWYKDGLRLAKRQPILRCKR